MRSHGVPNFPDPGAEGGANLEGSGINQASPAFKAAQVSCEKELPNGQPSRTVIASFKAQLVAMAECMRAQGVTDFPDPTTGPPPSNPAGYAIAEDLGGVTLAVPSPIGVNSPLFKQAARGMQRPLPALIPHPRKAAHLLSIKPEGRSVYIGVTGSADPAAQPAPKIMKGASGTSKPPGKPRAQRVLDTGQRPIYDWPRPPVRCQPPHSSQR
jgi:hypothetical protein